MHRIVVLGAGYAGLLATVSLAGRLRRCDDVRMTLVNPSERFTERLRLHQAAAGGTLADLSIPAMLAGTGVELLRGRVTAVDVTTRTVRTDDSGDIGYDTLVYALGAVADTTRVPGAGAHARTLDTLADARLIADRLAQCSEASVVVCGTGLTGVEAAAEIAERHPHLSVTLVGRSAPGAGLGPRARAHLTAALDRLGVRVRLAEIVEVRAGSVETTAGSIPAGTVLWVSGVRVPALAPGLATDDRGRILSDPALRSVSHPEVFAIGDAAAVRQPYGIMHGTCQGGMPTAAHAAASIHRKLTGKEPRPFRFGYLHVPVSLGRHDAVVQFTHPDDSPRRACLTGRPAVWYKETVSASPWPTFRRTIRLPHLTMLGWRRG